MTTHDDIPFDLPRRGEYPLDRDEILDRYTFADKAVAAGCMVAMLLIGVLIDLTLKSM